MRFIERQEIISARQQDQMEEIAHVLDVVRRKSGFARQRDHPREQGRGRLATRQGALPDRRRNAASPCARRD